MDYGTGTYSEAPASEVEQDPAAALPQDDAPAPASTLPICFDPEADVESDDRKDEVVQKCVETFKDYAECSQRKNEENRWRLAYRLYKGWRESNSPFEVVIREVYRQTEITTTQLWQALLAEDTSPTYLPRLNGYDEEAEGASNMVRDQISRFGSKQQQAQAIKNCVIYGLSYIIPGYREFKQVNLKMQSMHAENEASTWEKVSSEVIEGAPYLEHIQCWDVYSHPHIEEAKDSPAVFIRKGISPSALKTLIRAGRIDRDETKKAIEANKGRGVIDQPDRGLYIYGDDLDRMRHDDTPHEIIFCWMADGWEYVIIDRQWLVRAAKLEAGRIPITTWRFTPMAEEHFSDGIPMIIAEEQRVVNQMMAYYMGQLGFSSNPVLLIKRGSTTGAAWENLAIRPGSKLPVDDMNDVAYLQYPNQTLEQLQNSIGWMQEHEKRATGASDEIAGAGTSAKTATGQVHLEQSAGARFQYIANLLMPGLIEQYRWMYNLNAWNMRDEKYSMRVAGPDGGAAFKEYDKSVFEPDVDVTTELSEEASPEKAVLWQNNLKMLQNNPLIDFKPVLEELLKASGAKRIKRFFASSQNAQGDAIKEQNQLTLAGYIPDPKAGDDHMTHAQIHQQFMQTPQFQMLAQQNPQAAQYMQSHLAQHMFYVQQMQAAQAQAQQAQASMQGQGATGVQPEANARAGANFQMGNRGASQNQPMQGAA